MTSATANVPENSGRFRCIPASTPGVLDEVYRLRYACYRRKGSIEENPEQRFSDAYDTQPNSFSFLVRDSMGQGVATVRITVVSPDRGWTDSPVCQVYGDHPVFQELASESYVEASRLCFGPLARRDAFVSLVGNMAALAQMHHVGWLIACPRVEHAGTYQRMFGFKPLAQPRQYFGVKFDTQLLGVRIEELRSFIRRAAPMLKAWSDAYVNLCGQTGAFTEASQMEAVSLFPRLFAYPGASAPYRR